MFSFVRSALRKGRGMLGELWATLLDAVRCGDLRGHLAAWWAVASGRVTGETRAQVGGME